jgi:hypothetical protein
MKKDLIAVLIVSAVILTAYSAATVMTQAYPVRNSPNQPGPKAPPRNPPNGPPSHPPPNPPSNTGPSKPTPNQPNPPSIGGPSKPTPNPAPPPHNPPGYAKKWHIA